MNVYARINYIFNYSSFSRVFRMQSLELVYSVNFQRPFGFLNPISTFISLLVRFEAKSSIL